MTELVKTTIFKQNIDIRDSEDKDINSRFSIDTETDEPHDITQNVVNVSTDVNSTFTSIIDEPRNLSFSTAYGNIREFNCRSAYMSTDIIADDGYVDSNFISIYKYT